MITISEAACSADRFVPTPDAVIRAMLEAALKITPDPPPPAGNTRAKVCASDRRIYVTRETDTWSTDLVEQAVLLRADFGSLGSLLRGIKASVH